jgi:hypothetical protein
LGIAMLHLAVGDDSPKVYQTQYRYSAARQIATMTRPKEARSQNE